MIGKKVRVIGNTTWHAFNIGAVVEITQVTGFGYKARGKREDIEDDLEHLEWYLIEDEFEVIENE